MSKPIKLGMVGLGRAGYSMHLREMKGKEELFDIVAVCDCEPDRVENMEKIYGCRTYHNVEDLVEDPEVEVVDIATRSCDHFKHAKTALEAGKIVFLEKPMCQTYREAEELFRLAEKYGERRLFIRHNRRFEPMFEQVNQIIDSGILGDVYSIRRTVCGYEVRADWQTLSQYGGGQLLNWGPHLVDQALQFCGGDYKQLYAVTRQVLAAGDCEDYVRADFVGINDRIVEIEISGASALPQPVYVINGTRGSLIDLGKTYRIRYLKPGFELPQLKADPHTPAGARFHPGPELDFVEEELPWYDHPLDQTWVYLYEAVRNGADYPIKSAEAMNVMKAIEEIKRQNACMKG